METAEGLGAREERCRNSGERCRPWTKEGGSWGGVGAGSHQINFTKTWALAAKGPPEMSWAAGTIVSQTGTVGPREGQGSTLVSPQAGPQGPLRPRTLAPGAERFLLLVPGMEWQERGRAEPRAQTVKDWGSWGPEARGGVPHAND